VYVCERSWFPLCIYRSYEVHLENSKTSGGISIFT
jgi:hypothetical protein